LSHERNELEMLTLLSEVENEMIICAMQVGGQFPVVVDPIHALKFSARNLGDPTSICKTQADRSRKVISHNLDMHAGRKSDMAIVPEKP
jgi:hypothetical protein